MTYYLNSSAETEPTAHKSVWHRLRPGDADGHTSFLFWLTVLALGGVSLLSVTWLASTVLAKKGSEKLLRVDLLLPKLKSIHGERKATAFPMSEPEPSELAHPKERNAPAPALLPAVIDHPRGTIVETPHTPAATPEPPRFASTEPAMHLIPQVDLTPPPIETCDEPVVFLHPCTTPRGDSPMIRNWKALTMYSLMAAAAVTLAPPPPMVFAEDKKVLQKIEDDKLQELTKRITALENKKLTDADKEAIAEVMRAELKKLEDGALAKINKELGEINKNVSALKTEQLRQQIQIDQQKALIDQLTKKLEAGPTSPTVDKAMLETLKAIQDGIAKLATKETKERVMNFPPNGTAANMGRVMLVNHYSEDLLFLINGARHRVPANTSKLVENVPAGAINIEVAADRFGLFNRQVVTLPAGQTFALTATPQR